ncbi:guanylate cyclase soluble subunit alpha-2-like, partial [Physella acuta]|uniref:guanylate cyclase soluble subunit alpha-2-like n=1 Tax=Physella acuta TaxID=109671 RepID=UPI0027DD4061
MSCPIRQAIEEDLRKRAEGASINTEGRGTHSPRSLSSPSMAKTSPKLQLRAGHDKDGPDGCVTTRSLTSSKSSSSGEIRVMRKISPAHPNPILNLTRKVSPPHPNHVKFYTVSEDTPSRSSDDVTSESSTHGSLEGSPRKRKISSMSTSSLGSEGESEQSGERKVDITSLIEGVGTLIIPANYYIRRAIQNLINMRNPRVLENLRNESSELFSDELLQRSQSDSNLRHEAISDETLVAMATEAAGKLSMELQEVLRILGREYFKLCLGDYGKALKILGSNLLEFFSNIDGLQDQVKSYPRFQGQPPPSFRCDWQKGQLSLHYYSLRHAILSFVAGTVESVSLFLFQTEVQLQISANRDRGAPHHIFYITTANDNNENSMDNIFPHHSQLSTNPSDSKIGVHTFCASFPFHVIFDADLQITQLGVSLAKMISPEVTSKGKDLSTYFDIVKPPVKFSFSSILSRVNSSFVVRTKGLTKDKHRLSDSLELKGQMLFLQETDSILFLGSPSVEKLDELIGKGIYISDIPIHDATRDVILVGEQTKAQDGLKKRMEQLKKSIETASKAVDVEKQKNVDLLLEIFPPTIAQKLWRGEEVEPMTVDDVTMLFSDIVGFTAICSTATPMQVVDMLNSLYTHFDQYCVDIDVYKIETIGDAYCVAGGLHKVSQYHAQQIAWMALKMMAAAKNEKAHDGAVIKMRIGIHTG